MRVIAARDAWRNAEREREKEGERAREAASACLPKARAQLGSPKRRRVRPVASPLELSPRIAKHDEACVACAAPGGGHAHDTQQRVRVVGEQPHRLCGVVGGGIVAADARRQKKGRLVKREQLRPQQFCVVQLSAWAGIGERRADVRLRHRLGLAAAELPPRVLELEALARVSCERRERLVRVALLERLVTAVCTAEARSTFG